MTDNTKNKIAKALLSLAATKPLYKIEITEIIKVSSVSTQSYYNNFHSIDDILLYIYNYVDNDIYNYVVRSLRVNKKKNDTTPIFMLATIIPSYLYKKRDILRILYSKNLRGPWEDFLENRYKDISLDYLFNEKHIEFLGIKKAEANELFVKNILVILETWLTNKVPDNPETLKKKLLKLLFNPFLIKKN